MYDRPLSYTHVDVNLKFSHCLLCLIKEIEKGREGKGERGKEGDGERKGKEGERGGERRRGMERGRVKRGREKDRQTVKC